ncbi:MAG TPA: beta-galactosidase, partial [Clostridiales bacterium]|nr:beta-galactosidase [Clostridiales bacterium]
MKTEFGYNRSYLTKEGKAWFPVMGEIHYSRVPKDDWRESLYKMKAGGVVIASSYVIWIHHEEIEGEYDFTGNKDLRSFVTACKEAGLYFFLRIGPWIHGEVRNGGFPDWLVNKGYKLRYDDPGYLKEVKKYYSRIYDEVKGLFYKDGGPIIGVQIENELGHCGGAYGEAGEQHMKTLHKMAKDIGFDVPYYTATGWGGAATGGLLPVMGGYPDAPWDPRLTELEPSGNYVFTHERNDHNIGSDYGLGEGVTFEFEKFP